ncbi:hypothetical protein EJ06DRAFT_585831 [Trichodelitschia bisporula]|uniref:Uncharacterized protein n=1 Tax=Trichodelitschia bisporula TaxID=703511 RepID=A0A6G1HI99_9PEZI|nr:hypothetical protein EJ06DRAFT_585831 [Trichodelitschia bisporula]
MDDPSDILLFDQLIKTKEEQKKVPMSYEISGVPPIKYGYQSSEAAPWLAVEATSEAEAEADSLLFTISSKHLIHSASCMVLKASTFTVYAFHPLPVETGNRLSPAAEFFIDDPSDADVVNQPPLKLKPKTESHGGSPPPPRGHEY